MTKILDGFITAKQRRLAIKEKVDKLIKEKKRVPGLAVVIVGEDPASKTYVASKTKLSQEIGFKSETIAFDVDISQESLIKEIELLNSNPDIDGILVQLPLPNHINEDAVIDSISPLKDVDGLHPLNVGYLELNKANMIPCTPKGIMTLLDTYNIELEGKRALVIGRSRLVGKPISTLLLQRNATVTTAHSRTKNLDKLIQDNDIIVVAIGQREFIKASQLNENHVLIDVGIHRHEGKLCGDVEKAAYSKVAYATPVPKGVGPMTIASLLENTYEAYRLKELQNEV